MIRLEVFTAEEWKQLSEVAHDVVFKKLFHKDNERIDFALMGVNEEGKPCGYVTCVERDADTLYWQFGGTFPGTKSTSVSYQVYRVFLDWCKQHYKRVTFLVENNNLPMLKMAMMGGFKIVGLRNFKGSILLEHLLEFENE